MRILYYFFALFCGLAVHASAIAASSMTADADAVRAANKQLFIENRGQWDAAALFCLPSPEISVWGTTQGIVYDYRRVDSTHIHGQVVRMEFVGAQTAAVTMQERVATQYNYFCGRDTSKWATGIHGAQEVLYRAVYRGVDMRLYIDGGLPRYDFVLAPGTDPSTIVLRFRGMDALTVHSSELRLHLRERDIVQSGLFAYQTKRGQRRQIECRFVQHSDNSIGFEVGNYDPALPLIIDPLVYSTFLGGVLGDEGYGIELDADFNMYIAGSTLAQNYPVTTGAYSTTKAGAIDIVASKINRIGSQLAYSTFIGGDDDDFGYDIAVDASGKVALTGCSFSADFPVSPTAFDATLGGDRDAVVVRLNESGSRLEGSTYLGGNNWDEGYSLVVDASGTVAVTGMTTSSDFPVANAFDDSYNGAQDAFVVRMNRDVSSVSMGSFLGGSSGDQGNAIALDNSGNILVVGTTGSSDFQITASAFDRTFNGNVGTTDAFAAKISSGGALVFSTYIGGSENDEGRGVAPDATGGVALGGFTSSPAPGFPITSGAYDTELNGIDAFLGRLNAAGTALVACTYVGQVGADAITDIDIDNSGALYAVGYTMSSTFPTTIGAHDATFNGGDRDAFLVKFAPSLAASTLLYGTYLGGNNYDEAKSLAVDSDGNAAITGITRSGNYPTTSGALNRDFAGMSDVFVAKVGTGSPVLQLLSPIGDEQWCAGNSYKIEWRSRSVAYVRVELSTNAGVSYSMVLVDSVPALFASWGWSIPLTFTPGTQYRIRIVNVDNTQIKDEHKNTIAIHTPPTITSQPQSIATCVGATVVFRTDIIASPAAAIQWQYSLNGNDWLDVAPPAGQQNPLVLNNIQVSQNNVRYRMKASNLCNTGGVISSTATLSVRSQPRILSAPANVAVCAGDTAILEVTADEPGVSYQWRCNGKPVAGATGRQIILSNVSAIHAGVYDVVVTGICPPSVISTGATLSVQLPPEVVRAPVFRAVLCSGEVRDTTLTLRNAGPFDITVKDISLSNQRFTVIDPIGEFVVQAGTSRQVQVRFTPTRAEFEQGELVLSTLPCGHDVRIPLAARADSLHLTSADVAFDALSQCDTARTAIVRLVNSGTANLPVHRAEFSHPAFTLVWPQLPFTVRSNGGWVDAVVRFADDGTSPSVLATVSFASDTCPDVRAVSNLAVRRDKLSHQPSQGQIDFGAIAACDSHVDKTFLLFNTGTAEITIDSFYIDNAAFGVVRPAVGFSLKPGEFTEIMVRFSGASSTLFTGRLTIYESVCRATSSVELRGTRVGASFVSGVTAVAMGSYLACSTIPDTTFVLSNISNSQVVIDRVDVDPPFKIVSPSFPATIAPGDSLRVTVRVGSGSGDISGQAVFSFRADKCSTALSVALSASRLLPVAVLNPAKILPFELNACDEYRDTVVVLRNDGAVALTLDYVKCPPAMKLLTSLPVVVRPGRVVELRLRAQPSGQPTGAGEIVLHIAECDTSLVLPVDVRKPGASFALAADNGGDTLFFDAVYNCAEQVQKRKVRIDVAFEKGDPVDVSVSAVSLSSSAVFSTTLLAGTKLAAGESWFDVEFIPASDGTYTAVLSVTFQPCGITKKIVLIGQKLSAAMAAPAGVLFGTVQQGGSRTMRVVYRNTGTAPVRCASLRTNAPFRVVATVPALPAVIAPGDSLLADTEFTAGDGEVQETMVLYALEPCEDSVVVLLIGKGANLPTTVLTGPALDFGDVLLGASTQRTLVIYNQGSADAVLYGSPLLLGADATEFSLLTMPLAVIPPGDSTAFEVRFSPLTVGNKTALCRIEYNGVRLDIDVTGRGIERGPALSTVFLPDTAATPFTRNVRLPLMLIPGENFDYALVDSFVVELQFNPSLFALKGVEHAAIVSDTTVELGAQARRVLSFAGKHHFTPELSALVGDVLLGDTIATSFDMVFHWTTPDVAAQSKSGRLSLLGVRDGLLVRSKGRPGFVSLGPNPSHDILEFDVRTIEVGEHRVELFDVTGKTVWSSSWVFSSGERSGAVYRLRVPTAQCASGSYSLYYTAPSGYTDRRTVIIVH